MITYRSIICKKSPYIFLAPIRWNMKNIRLSVLTYRLPKQLPEIDFWNKYYGDQTLTKSSCGEVMPPGIQIYVGLQSGFNTRKPFASKAPEAPQAIRGPPIRRYKRMFVSGVGEVRWTAGQSSLGARQTSLCSSTNVRLSSCGPRQTYVCRGGVGGKDSLRPVKLNIQIYSVTQVKFEC